MNRSPYWMKKALIALLVFDLALYPVAASADGERITGVLKAGQSISSYRSMPAVAQTELPVLLNPTEPGQGVDSVLYDQNGESSRMTVKQDEEKAVVDWETFNIGRNAEVYFDQAGNANWYALNRIYDANPSQIFGQLSADGKVFLINQNGFLFGSDSRVTNLHSLVATSLNISNQDYLAGIYDFNQEDYQHDYRLTRISDPDYANYVYDPDQAFIDFQGQIRTQTGGVIYMLAPSVENTGVIDAPGGQAALVAGEEVSLYSTIDQRTERSVQVSRNPGTVINRGSISADQGVAGMYGRVVNQEGLIRSVTAVYRNGTVELMASERITTAAENSYTGEGGSYTGCPLSESDDTVQSSFETGMDTTVRLTGLEVRHIGVGSDHVPIYDYPDVIEHQGVIEAPSGNVVLEADNRIFIENNSIIDVSGAWADGSASENEIDVQLNSVELSDEFIAREGDIKGATITVNALEGSDIGHIDGYLNIRQEDIARRSATGGTVTLKVSGDKGEVIVKEDAEIDFSGGGIHYASGHVQTSQVAINGTIYDIDDIPADVLKKADELVLVDPSQQGAGSRKFIPAYDEGSDAGTLTIEANTVVLDGRLDGSVTRGTYQTMPAEPSVTIGDITYQTARGRREPLAGTLEIGDFGTSELNTDRGTDTMVIRSSGNVLEHEFAVDDPLADKTTILSAERLNDAGLGALHLAANYSISTEADSTLKLTSDYSVPDRGSLIMVARSIHHQGSIIMPGGSVYLSNDYNYTSEMDPSGVVDGIWLESGSRIDVSGETLNQRRASSIDDHSTHLAGGSIEVIGNIFNSKGTSNINTVDSNGVFVEAGAQLDVSGGYLIGVDGSITGADAGSLSIIGKQVKLEGTLKGQSLLGYSGGSLRLGADRILVYDTSAVAGSSSGLTLGDDRLDESGFSEVVLESARSTILGNGAWLRPSVTKFYVTTANGSVAEVLAEPSILDLERTTVTLKAGTSGSRIDNHKDYGIRIDEGAGIEVHNGGSIQLSASAIEVNGTLMALGGAISAKAKYGNVALNTGSRIDASGFNSRTLIPQSAGLPMGFEAHDGGRILLEAVLGTVSVAPDAIIDVSGSGRVTNVFKDLLGDKHSYSLASQAGSIEIVGKAFDISGKLRAITHLDNLAGGTLALTSTDAGAPLVLSAEELMNYTASDTEANEKAGNFDALRLTSMVGLEFDIADDEPGMTLGVPRLLVLDAPYLQASAGKTLAFESSHVSLQNSIEKYKIITNTQTNLTSGIGYLADPLQGSANSNLVINSDWLDISGHIALSEFEAVKLTATYDMTLSDQPYVLDKAPDFLPTAWSGRLATYADLTLEANRIYPQTDAIFTISTGTVDAQNNWTGGILNIAQGGGSARDGAILSANGELILEANTINHSGTLLAPMGRLVLNGLGAGSSIALKAGSILSTKGNAAVEWGTYNDDRWSRLDKNDSSQYSTLLVEDGPDSGIIIAADSVIMQAGALTDVSGGGMVYAYEFQPSISGSADPQGRSDCYVLVLDNSVQLPGEAIYIPQGYGIPEGTYSMLPEAYAFLPNAYIVNDLGVVNDTSWVSKKTTEGFTQAIGYFSNMANSLTSSSAHIFSVRKASDVLSEGLYSGDMILAGNGGRLIVSAGKATIEGDLRGVGLDGYRGGNLQLGADHIILSSTSLDEWIDQHPGNDLEGVLYLKDGALDGSGFASLELGNFKDRNLVKALLGELSSAFSLLDDRDEDSPASSTSPYYRTGIDRQTQTVFIAENVSMDIDSMGIYAEDSIQIEAGGLLNADELIMANLAGEVKMAAGMQISATALGVFSNTLNTQADLNISEVLAFGSNNNISLTGTGVLPDGAGWSGSMQINADTWTQFAETANVAIATSSGITTIGEVDVHARELLYLNTPQINGMAHNNQLAARFSASNIVLTNTIAQIDDPMPGNANGSLLMEAENDFRLGPGVLRLFGFADVELSAGRDFAMVGSGELNVGSDLALTAARVTVAPDIDDSGNYHAADYTVNTGNYQLSTYSNGAASTNGWSPGGNLTFKAASIVHAGVIDNFAGGISLIADNGVFLQNGSKINAQGGILSYLVAGEPLKQAYQAGQVYVDSGSGVFELAEGAQINVSNIVDVSYVDGKPQRPEDIDAQTWEGWIDAGYLDSGKIAIQSAAVDAIFAGDLIGNSSFGRGGSFDLTTLSFDFSTLAEKLSRPDTVAQPDFETTGGFTNRVAMRALTDNIIVAEGDTLSAQQINLTADGGGIDVFGHLNVSGNGDDGLIQLLADGNVNLHAGSELDASGTGIAVDGGQINISSSSGWIQFDADAMISVQAGADGTGGSVHFRSTAFDSNVDGINDDVRMALSGTIRGAEHVGAEAVVLHDVSATQRIIGSDIANWQNELASFMSTYSFAISSRLTSALNLEGMDTDVFQFVPGLEVISQGDISLNTQWDLGGVGWRYGSDNLPGMLTLRAGGDLNIQANLFDQPHTDVKLMSEDALYDSWGLTLTAGAQLNGADPLAVVAGIGDLKTTDRVRIYTESNNIRIAAGRNIALGKGYYDLVNGKQSYSIATHDGNIQAYAGGNMNMVNDNGQNASAIQTHTGDIAVAVGGDINLGLNSAIRTIGWLDLPDLEYLVAASGNTRIAQPYLGYATMWDAYLDGHSGAVATIENLLNFYGFNRYAEYADGGDVDVAAGGAINGRLAEDAFYLRYDFKSTGRSTSIYDYPVGGASYTYDYLRDTNPSSGIIALSGGDVHISAGQEIGNVQMAAFETGDLFVASGGDADGRYLVEDGRAYIMSMQHFGAQSPDRAIEIIDTIDGPSVDVQVVAQGNIDIGGVINPLAADMMPDNFASAKYYYFQYTEDTRLGLITANGDVNISGESEFYNPEPIVGTALPATVAVVAGNNINFVNQETMWLTPSSTGNLVMIAGEDIRGLGKDQNGQRTYNQLVVSNLAPEQVYAHLTLPGMDVSQLHFKDLDNIYVNDDADGFLPAYVETFEGWWETQDNETRNAYQALFNRIYEPSGLHRGDKEPIQIRAGNNITNLALNLPEQAEITADGSITDFYFRLQHNNDDDNSVVTAGESILLSPLPAINDATQPSTYLSYLRQVGLEVAGPGSVMVGAGQNIDLGLGDGLRTVSNTFNTILPNDGASLIISSGFDVEALFKGDLGEWQPGKTVTFFDELLDGGIAYSALKYGKRAEGDSSVATDIAWARGLGDQYATLLQSYSDYEDVPKDVRDQLAAIYLNGIKETIISPVLIDVSATGDTLNAQIRREGDTKYAKYFVHNIDFAHVAQSGEINMTQSQIFTQQRGDINIIAASDFNVGVTAFSNTEEKSNSGVNTMKGGDINIYTGLDLNVDESRIMTWYGGDIMLWSNAGSINAGKGSKTTVSVSEPVKQYDELTDSYYLEYTLPAVGSGIRLLTYDPDGPSGPKKAPLAGDAYLFAPEGEIDAGEAGIVGQGNILLAAAVLTNTQNIDVGGLSVGADLSQDSGEGVGGLTGGGSATAADTSASEDMALSSAKDRFDKYVTSISDSLVPRWLAVEVIGFGQDEEDEDEDSVGSGKDDEEKYSTSD